MQGVRRTRPEEIMTDISMTVHNVIVATFFAIAAMNPQGRALFAAQILCMVFVMFTLVQIFVEMPMPVAIDPVVTSRLGKAANLAVIAVVIWFLVSSSRRLHREPAKPGA